jgi:hypothetical protein
MFGQTKSQALLQKSGSIVDVFRSTIVKLEDVNAEIAAEDTNLANKQIEIAAEREALQASKAQNEKIVGKIQSFFA